MAPVSKRTDLTKQERVYRAVRERILSGTYGPGFRVVIDALARSSASRPPGARGDLAARGEGLVIYRPNAGAQVAPADPARSTTRCPSWR
jgi:DNA-binding GntR family transcriptional regulator